MKKLLALFLITLCLTVNSEETEAQSAGLRFQTYAAGGPMPAYTQGPDGTITNRTLLSTGTVSTVNYNWGGSWVLNSGRNEGVIVRFYGFINISTAGTYWFGGQADDGIRIKVNNIQVVDSWIESGGAFRNGSVNLPAGVVPIELLYYENGGGAMVNLQWFVNGAWQIIPSTALATESTFWGPTSAPTAVYSSGITTPQQTRKINNLNQNTGHNAQIEILGNDNIVNVQQIGTGHFVQIDVTGNVNTINVLQTSTTTARHYLEAAVTGSNNTATLTQRDTAKTAFVEITGNANTVTMNQKNSGNHYLNLSVTGNNHSATVVQEGSGSHSATVRLNGSQPWNFNLNQSGSTNKTYSLPHSMTDGSTVSGTCSAIGGCNLTVNQQ